MTSADGVETSFRRCHWKVDSCCLRDGSDLRVPQCHEAGFRPHDLFPCIFNGLGCSACQQVPNLCRTPDVPLWHFSQILTCYMHCEFVSLHF